MIGGAARRGAAVALLVAGLGYLVVELVVARAWSAPPYDWVENLVTDLGSRGSGLNHQGLFVSSPRHALMNAGFAGQGLLFGAAVLLLSRPVGGRARTALVVLGVLHALTLVTLALVPTSPDASTATLVTNITAGSLALLTGNLAIVVLGRQWRRAALPRLLGLAGTVLGAAGIVLAAGLTLLSAPTGLAERVGIDSFVVWQVLAGAALLRGPSRAAST